LKEQRPGKDFYLFDNFVGEVRSMAYWEDDYLDEYTLYDSDSWFV